MKKKIQKPFDVETAKKGAKVETRDGQQVRIVCYDRKGKYPIIALINNCKDIESCHSYNIKGKLRGFKDTNKDLVIVEEVEVPKFKEGEIIVDPSFMCPWLIIAASSDYYMLQDAQGHEATIYHVTIDNLYRLWTLKDAKPGDVLCCEDGRPFMLKELDCFGHPIAYFGINTIYKICEGDGSIWTYDKVRPATFREYNSLFKQLRIENYEYNVDTHEITKQEIAWRNKEGLSTKMNGYYINIDSNISSYDNGILCKNSYNVYSTEKQAKSALAMARISQIMANDKRFGGAISNEEWADKPWYVILRRCNNLEISIRYGYEFLAFHEKEQAQLFLKENEDLIKDYYMMN